jgi:chromosome partitioning protein
MIDGRTVMELAGSTRSAGEIKALWEYLAGRLSRGMRRTVLPQSTYALTPNAAPDRAAAARS